MKTMTHLPVLLAVAVLAAVPALAQRTPPVAMVTDVAGAVKLSAPKGPLTAGIATELPADSKIEVPAGGKLVVLFMSTGDEYTLSGPVTAQLRAGGLDGTPTDRLIRRASAVGKVRLKTDGLTQAAVTLRAAKRPEVLPLLSASGTRVLDARPVFRWKPVDGAGPYRFELQDSAGALLHEARTEATELRLPEGITLVEGKSYTWEVSARQANGAMFANFGDFTVAPAALRAEALRLKPAAGASVSDRASYALWLASQDLNDEARAAWRALASERPDDPQLKAMAER
jgi:hypothetical protein